MNLSQALLAEFDQEMASTRKTLERLPMDKYDWQPHSKSFSIGKLAVHLAQIPGWGTVTAQTSELDFSKPFEQPNPRTTQELLAFFDENVAQARAALAGMSEEDFGKPWTLRNGEQVFFTAPKAMVLRSFVMNHLVHHRAQLTVYLRLNDIPVPALYGPSADENVFG